MLMQLAARRRPSPDWGLPVGPLHPPPPEPPEEDLDEEAEVTLERHRPPSPEDAEPQTNAAKIIAFVRLNPGLTRSEVLDWAVDNLETSSQIPRTLFQSVLFRLVQSGRLVEESGRGLYVPGAVR